MQHELLHEERLDGPEEGEGDDSKVGDVYVGGVSVQPGSVLHQLRAARVRPHTVGRPGVASVDRAAQCSST